MHNHRKYRIDQETRDKYAEVKLSTSQFINPYFIIEGVNKKEPIETLPDVYRFSIDQALIDIGKNLHLGIDKILLFGVIASDLKDEYASYAYADGNIIEKAIKSIKKSFPGITIITDVCLCGYTSHGHCGILHGDNVHNDSTLPYLAKIALNHAQAGANIIAPSSMMDYQVQAIREKLDENAYRNVKILSYSAKFSSSFYGPFRDAANSAPSFGDRKTYQMDFRSISQPISEVDADLKEGADWVMVKPSHTYLDVIHTIAQKHPNVPLASYYVSGEYSLLKAAAQKNLIDEEAAVIEVHTALLRAGSNFIITYYAPFLAKLLKTKQDVAVKEITS
jgi:porphobilinogen synthase